MNPRSRSVGWWIGRVFLALTFIVGGILHLAIPHIYLRIMPPSLSHPGLLVLISGIAEILGGLGLLMEVTRRAAAWGLVALLIAVWPANLYMAMAHLPLHGIAGQSWAQWLRLPLQAPLIYWAWTYTRQSK